MATLPVPLSNTVTHPHVSMSKLSKNLTFLNHSYSIHEVFTAGYDMRSSSSYSWLFMGGMTEVIQGKNVPTDKPICLVMLLLLFKSVVLVLQWIEGVKNIGLWLCNNVDTNYIIILIFPQASYFIIFSTVASNMMVFVSVTTPSDLRELSSISPPRLWPWRQSRFPPRNGWIPHQFVLGSGCHLDVRSCDATTGIWW